MGLLNFWELELRSVFNRIEGYNQAEELRLKASWEQTRWQTAALLNVYAKKGQNISPTDLIRFPWEDQPVQNESDIQAINEMTQRRWAKWDAEMQANG